MVRESGIVVVVAAGVYSMRKRRAAITRIAILGATSSERCDVVAESMKAA